MLTVKDDPNDYIDAPISLQLVGRRYEDEKVIQAFEMIRDAVGLPIAQKGKRA